MLYSPTRTDWEGMHLFTSPRRTASAVTTSFGVGRDESPKTEEDSGKTEVERSEENEETSKQVEEGGTSGDAVGKKEEGHVDEEWASNLFYAYARRTEDSKASRYLLTFSSARVSNEWWTLIQREFGGPPSNVRESAQLFSFQGDDLPGKAWKNPKLEHLRTKWFYTQLGDGVGTGGRGQEVIPLQDEKGWVIGYRKSTQSVREKSPNSAGSMPSPPTCAVEAVQPTTDLAEERWKERRRSKRDSGIMIMSPHLANFDRRDSVDQQEQKPKFDFERMEKNLDKVEKLMEQNAKQMRSLEHVQAANMERLTSALVQNAEMVKALATGQSKLGSMVEELRKLVLDREEGGSTAVDSNMMSPSRVAPSEDCKHVVHVGRKPPRKIGRTVIGYVYAEGGKCVGKEE